MPINKITPADIRAWQNQILQATYISKKIQRKYSPTYINALYVQLSAIFNYAVTYYRLPSNPAKLAGGIGKTKAHAMKFWTIGQFNINLFHPFQRIVRNISSLTCYFIQECDPENY